MATSQRTASGPEGTCRSAGSGVSVYRLDIARRRAGFDVGRLPFSLKILLENLLRHEDGLNVTAESIEALASWADHRGGAGAGACTAHPDRVLAGPDPHAGLHRRARRGRPGRDARCHGGPGRGPAAVQPQVPAELVIDHSVIADFSGRADAFSRNSELEFQRNGERYRFLRWGQQAFGTLKVVPPNTGICHQVNLEHLAQVVFRTEDGEAYPDTLARHGLPHDDGERARRPRLGGRRDRGGSCHARRAGHDAHPRCRRLQIDWRAARGLDRNRPRADGYRAAPQARRRRQVC